MTPAVRKLVQEGASSTAIREVAEAGGMQNLREDARRKVLAGMTTVDEVIRVTAESL